MLRVSGEANAEVEIEDHQRSEKVMSSAAHKAEDFDRNW